MKLLKFLIPLLLVAFIQSGGAWAAVINRGDDFGNFVRLKNRTVDTRAQISVFQPPPGPAKGFYILQFKGPVEESWKRDISALGVRFLGYIPDNAFIVKIPPSSFSDVQSDPNVKWLGEYLPDDRIGKRIKAAIPPPGQTRVKKFVVKVFDGEDMSPIINTIRSLGGEVEVVSDSDTLNGKTLNVTIDEAATINITSIPSVESIEVQPVHVLHNDVAVQPGQMNVTPVWSLPVPLTGNGQVVGIIDTGIDTGDTSAIHPAFGNMSSGLPKIKYAFTYGRPGDWSDPNGHGTHTSGSLAGMALQGYNIKGVAYNAQIVLQSALGSTPGSLYIPDLNSTAFPDAYGQGVRVHNNSWGDVYTNSAGQYNTDSISADTFAWNHKEFLAVFSAGNDGVDNSPADGIVDQGSISPPATAKNVLAVGASENYRPTQTQTYGQGFSPDYSINPLFSDPMANNPNGMVAFSSRGPTDDGRIKPDVVAPGTWILSTRSTITTLDESSKSFPYWGLPSNVGLPVAMDSYFAFDGGTSMSAPLTTGAAALVRQYYTDIKNVTDPSAALIKAAIINGATNMYPGQYTAPKNDVTAWPDNNQGFGRVNLARSVAPTAPSIVEYVDDNTGFATGSHDTDTYAYTIGDTSVPVRVTLAWTDYPATLAASTKLVNDLDLEVTAPNGVDIYHGNKPGKNLVVFDHLNNVESVEIPASDLITGTLTVKVIASGINQGPQQPYALAIRYGKNAASISPTSASYGKAGGNGSVSVTTSNSWTATSNAAWIAVTSGSSGTGNSTVNYSVAAYSGSGSRTDSIIVAGQTFTVTQTGVQDLTISASPADEGSVSPASGPYDYNSTISLKATPNAGYVFTGWSGSITGSTNPVSVKMDSDKTVVANFHSNIYNLTVSSNPSVGGTTDLSSGTYEYNTHLTINAIPADGYVFSGWSGSVTGTANPINITMNSDKTVVANFKRQGVVLGYTQNLSKVTLTATMYYNDQPVAGKNITFYDKLNTSSSFSSKGSATTNSNGVATKTFTASVGNHTAYAKFTASGGIPTMQSTNMPYTMGKVYLTSPANLSTKTASPLTFTWTPLAGASNYHLQVSTSSKFGTGTQNFLTPNTSYDVDASLLIPGKSYYWRVYADIPTGTTMYSDRWKFTYKKGTLLSIASPEISGSTVTLRATLTGSDGVTPIPGKSITFYENTNGGLYSSKGKAATGSLTSLSPGVATRNWTMSTGNHDVYAKFAGDSIYAPPPQNQNPANVSYSH